MSLAMKQQGLEWETNGLPEAPSAPETLKQAGLTPGFLNDMILKTLYTRGGLLGLDLARTLCLPFNVIEDSLRFLKDDKCLEVAGGDLIGRVSYRFNLTELGRRRAEEALKFAPTSVRRRCRWRTTSSRPTGKRSRASASPPRPCGVPSHLVIKDDLFNAIGPAIVAAGVGVHLWAARQRQDLDRRIVCRNAFRCGALSVRALCCRASDPHLRSGQTRASERRGAPTHRAARIEPAAKRSLRERPRSSLGEDSTPGDLRGRRARTSDLNLTYDPLTRQYQAPAHLKAQDGIFLIDDFGRQRARPEEILNRWILPLEDRHDYLTVASGKKFEVPFEQLIIFSTNLDPKDLVDDAFLRRIRHKVEIQCAARRVRAYLQRRGQTYGNEHLLRGHRFPVRAALQLRPVTRSDGRDLLEIVQAICRYRNQPVQLSRDLYSRGLREFHLRIQMTCRIVLALPSRTDNGMLASLTGWDSAW